MPHRRAATRKTRDDVAIVSAQNIINGIERYYQWHLLNISIFCDTYIFTTLYLNNKVIFKSKTSLFFKATISKEY